jgi:nitrogen fixation NifU-like protein
MSPKYSQKILDHFERPRNVGEMEHPDVVGRSGAPGRGNYMILYLRIVGNQVKRATFQTYGCPGAIACGSVMTELVQGKAPEECAGMAPADVTAALDGLPLGKRHCADLVIDALRDALRQIGPRR